MYDLQDVETLLDSPVPRPLGERQLLPRISHKLSEKIVCAAKLYCTLKYLNIGGYSLGKGRPLLNLHTFSTRDPNKVRVKLKLAAGIYIFQTNRATFNHTNVKSTCLLCNDGNETVSHFLLL